MQHVFPWMLSQIYACDFVVIGDAFWTDADQNVLIENLPVASSNTNISITIDAELNESDAKCLCLYDVKAPKLRHTYALETKLFEYCIWNSLKNFLAVKPLSRLNRPHVHEHSLTHGPHHRHIVLSLLPDAAFHSAHPRGEKKLFKFNAKSNWFSMEVIARAAFMESLTSEISQIQRASRWEMSEFYVNKCLFVFGWNNNPTISINFNVSTYFEAFIDATTHARTGPTARLLHIYEEQTRDTIPQQRTRWTCALVPSSL